MMKPAPGRHSFATRCRPAAFSPVRNGAFHRTPFPLGENLAEEIESLGRVLLQFYRAVNLLYRKSAEGKQPEWVARWLDLGKPAS